MPYKDPEVAKARSRAYYEKNKIEIKKYAAEYREKNKEHLNVKNRERYAKDPEKYIAYQHAYRDKDSSTRAVYEASRRKYAEANRELIAERQRDYVARNLEKVRTSNRRYEVENREARVEASRERWVNRTPEQAKRAYEASRAWQEANPERVRAAGRKSYYLHRERRLEAGRAWSRANPEKIANGSRRRRALARGAESDGHTFAELCEYWLAMGLDPGQCSYCDKECLPSSTSGSPDMFTIDHIVPLIRGGTHCMDNLTPSCKGCNSSKNDRLLHEEWTPPNMGEKV